MRKQVLILMTTAAILACGAIVASGQAPGAQTPSTQQCPMTQPTPGPMLQQSRHRRQPDAWRRNLEHELEAKSRGHYRGNKSEYALFGEPSFSGPLAPSNIKKVAAPVLGGRKVGVMHVLDTKGLSRHLVPRSSMQSCRCGPP